MTKIHEKGLYKKNKTGLIYDPMMEEYNCEWDPFFPEKPDRIKKPFERCQLYGLVEECINIPGRFCSDEEILKCHADQLKNVISDSENMNLEDRMNLSTKFDSVYFHSKTNKAARFALGSSIELLDQIMTGKVDNGFAIIRPPGHHAQHNEANGYCYFNNAAVVAKLAIDKYGLERVLIVDWDVHHGQGTQYQFYDDPRVLYFSIHRYDYGKFWPNLRESDFDFIGEMKGKGFNINIPLNKTGLGNTEYLASFFNVLLPIAYEFNPQLVIVSSGFDSCVGDEKGCMNVTPAGYAHMMNALSVFSNGKICALLEGGYCIKSLSEGVAMSIRTLLGYPCPRIAETTKSDPVFVETMMNLVSVLRPYWKCLQSLNDVDDFITLEQYLLKWDEKYRKNIDFYTNEKRPLQFELTGNYPVQPDEEKYLWDKKINDLIESTDLFVPEKRTCFQVDQNIKYTNENFSKVEANNFDKYSSLETVIDNLDQRKFTNGLVILENFEQVVKFNKYERFKKILNIVFDENFANSLSDESNVLNVIIGSECRQSNQNNIFLNQLNDTSLVTCFLRIVLPIAYQFNPDIVLIFVGKTCLESQITEMGLGHVFKFLSSLANGNQVFIFQNGDTGNYIKILKVAEKVLDGDSIDLPTIFIPDESERLEIKKSILELKSNWKCFQFNDKIPQWVV